MVGSEGLAGAAPIVLGVDRSPYGCFIQMAGKGLRLSTHDLREAVRQSPSLQRLLLRYVQSLLTQTAQTAFANAHYTVEKRLARWLLMCRDRADSDSMELTHEFLSMMLGVRRPGVTVALQTLEGNGLIGSTRGRVLIRDRKGLEALAKDSYGVAEAEYAKLIEGEGDAALPSQSPAS